MSPALSTAKAAITSALISMATLPLLRYAGQRPARIGLCMIKLRASGYCTPPYDRLKVAVGARCRLMVMRNGQDRFT